MPTPNPNRAWGIHCLEDLRQRCYINPTTGCWHWRLCRDEVGDPHMGIVIDGKRIHARGRRAALLLAGVDAAGARHAVAACGCTAQDCCNPEHAAWAAHWRVPREPQAVPAKWRVEAASCAGRAVG